MTSTRLGVWVGLCSNVFAIEAADLRGRCWPGAIAQTSRAVIPANAGIQ
jgi:hypothetical protein